MDVAGRCRTRRHRCCACWCRGGTFAVRDRCCGRQLTSVSGRYLRLPSARRAREHQTERIQKPIAGLKGHRPRRRPRMGPANHILRLHTAAQLHPHPRGRLLLDASPAREPCPLDATLLVFVARSPRLLHSGFPHGPREVGGFLRCRYGQWS